MNELQAWVERVCAELDLDPDGVDVPALLDVARDAAHQVARPAAPITTFLVGLAAGRDGADRAALERALTAVARLTADPG